MYPTLQFYEYRQTEDPLPSSIGEGEIHIWYLSGALTYEPVLRTLLGAYCHQPADEIRLERGEHGKPYCKAPQKGEEIFFNVTHSGDWTLLALSSSYRLGIDLQQKKPLSRKEAVAARLFHPLERQAYETLSEPMQTARFYRLWTIKEACLKCVGTGLSARGDQFYVELSQPEQEGRFLSVHPDYASATDWAVCALPCPTGYAASLSILSPDQASTIQPLGASIRPN